MPTDGDNEGRPRGKRKGQMGLTLGPIITFMGHLLQASDCGKTFSYVGSFYSSQPLK